MNQLWQALGANLRGVASERERSSSAAACAVAGDEVGDLLGDRPGRDLPATPTGPHITAGHRLFLSIRIVPGEPEPFPGHKRPTVLVPAEVTSPLGGRFGSNALQRAAQASPRAAPRQTRDPGGLLPPGSGSRRWGPGTPRQASPRRRVRCRRPRNGAPLSVSLPGGHTAAPGLNATLVATTANGPESGSRRDATPRRPQRTKTPRSCPRLDAKLAQDAACARTVVRFDAKVLLGPRNLPLNPFSGHFWRQESVSGRAQGEAQGFFFDRSSA